MLKVAAVFGALLVIASGELLKNGGFETLDGWACWSNLHCELSSDGHSGSHAFKVSNRPRWNTGPQQDIHPTPGHLYRAGAWVKLLGEGSDGFGERIQLEVAFHYTDGRTSYNAAAERYGVHTSDGWVYLEGDFSVPNASLEWTRVYFQGPKAGLEFMVDDTSITELLLPGTGSWRHTTRSAIDAIRKSGINIRVTTADHIDKNQVDIQVVQKTRPFPFGTAVACSAYNTKSRGNYRDFIHKHFNWAVTENALKWKVIESTQGQRHYQQALDCVRGLRSNNIKVRGHNLVWSVPVNVQGWQKALSGDILRRTVKNHITDVMNVTRRLLEHWDVNNENLHGTWYQDRLHDPDYDLELFRIAHAQDSHVKLFLNDFSVVAQGASTYAYLNQTIRFKAANVGLYGIGVQCHFPDEMEPNPDIIRHRLDILAQAGVPIWVTELDVMSKDDNRRADFYEMALSALFSHPAVEGIMLWGFWDKFSWRGEAGALVKGDHLELTAAGRRVFDLLENQWMTDETYVLSQTSDHFTLRGFHGDYEVRVHYQGKELGNLTQTFTLGDDEQDVTVHMHT
ncbi:uncharacterized protein [Littorina saxatilis]|uniref:GH10 domain-containing protein n=1 Tax=Littorina saxatilis TaxID=31220 RepID=A0AAN9GFA8_9CAEN